MDTDPDSDMSEFFALVEMYHEHPVDLGFLDTLDQAKGVPMEQPVPTHNESKDTGSEASDDSEPIPGPADEEEDGTPPLSDGDSRTPSMFPQTPAAALPEEGEALVLMQ